MVRAVFRFVVLYVRVCCHMQTRLAMDALAQLLMKGAVNCDTHSDLQNTVNHLEIECGMCLWVTPESWASSLLWACALELPVLSAVQYVKALDEHSMPYCTLLHVGLCCAMRVLTMGYMCLCALFSA